MEQTIAVIMILGAAECKFGKLTRETTARQFGCDETECAAPHPNSSNHCQHFAVSHSPPTLISVGRCVHLYPIPSLESTQAVILNQESFE